MDIVIYYISGILSFIEILILYKILTKKSVKIKLADIIYLNFSTILIIIFTSYNLVVFKMVYALFTLIILNYSIFQDKLKKTIFTTIIIWLLGILLDLITAFICSLLFTKLIPNYAIYLQTLSTIVLTLILFLISKHNKLGTMYNNFIKAIKNVKFSFILFNLFLIALMILDIWCYINAANYFIQLILIIITILLILYFLIIIYIISTKKILNETINYIIYNGKYIQKEYDNLSVFKHDLKNELLTVKSVANSQAQELIDILIDEYSTNDYVNNYMKNIPEGINGTIMQKLQPYLVNNNIKIKFDNKIKNETINRLKPRVYRNLCKNMCLLLDNALEACSKSKEKSLCITFTDDSEIIKIEIINTYNNDVDVDNIGYSRYSTKNSNHGLGLFSILRNKDVILNSKIIDNLFYTTLIIKKYNHLKS